MFSRIDSQPESLCEVGPRLQAWPLRSGPGRRLLHRLHVVSPGQNVHCSNHIGVIRKALGWAGSAGVVCRYGHEPAAGPCQFVLKLLTKSETVLVKDGRVQSGYGESVFSGLLCCAGC